MGSPPPHSLTATLDYVEEKTDVDLVFVNFQSARSDRGKWPPALVGGIGDSKALSMSHASESSPCPGLFSPQPHKLSGEQPHPAGLLYTIPVKQTLPR